MSIEIDSPSSVRPSPAGTEVRAAVGVVLLLVGALLLLGLAPVAMPESYSWIEHGTSESGAQTVDGAWVARSGFILFGLAVVWLVGLRRRVWGQLGALLHLGFGVSMLAVAAFSTKPWEPNAAYVESEDLLHDVFAALVGFGFIAGVLAVMLARRHPSVRAAAPDLTALVIASAVPLLMASNIWGVLQRVMFVTAGAWYGREAWLARQAPGHPAQEAITP